MKRARTPAQICRLRRVFQQTTCRQSAGGGVRRRTGSTTRRCRPSPASSTCRRQCSSGRRGTRRTAPMCASSRRCTSCPSPAIRRSARRSPSPRRPAAVTSRRSSCWRKRSGRCAARSREAPTACSPNSTCRGCPSPSHFPAIRQRWRHRSASTPHEIGFEDHVVTAYSGGVPYILVPVAGLAAAAKASLDTRAWMALHRTGRGAVARRLRLLPRDGVGAGNAFHARMFAGASRHPGRPGDGLGGGLVRRRDHALRPGRSTASAAIRSSRASRWDGRR